MPSSPKSAKVGLGFSTLLHVISRTARAVSTRCPDNAVKWTISSRTLPWPGDLAVRPIHHQNQKRIEAHIFVAFLAYALHVTLRRRLRDLAPGLTSRAVLEKLRSVPMVDVHLPTTDGREIVLTRYTQPDPEVAMILQRLKLQLPPQPPPRLNARKQLLTNQPM